MSEQELRLESGPFGGTWVFNGASPCQFIRDGEMESLCRLLAAYLGQKLVPIGAEEDDLPRINGAAREALVRLIAEAYKRNSSIASGFDAFLARADAVAALQSEGEEGREPPGCHAGKDGDCIWGDCPQLRDNEPQTSGRHCPLDVPDDDL